MDRLARELDLARDELTPYWSDERGAQLFAGTRERARLRARARGVRLASSALAVIALLIGGAVALHGAREAKLQAATSAAARGGAEPQAHMLRLADGSRAELVGGQSELEVSYNSKQRVGLRLVSGRAHFEVVHDPLRSFVVEAGRYRVEVIGTNSSASGSS